ncbi:MAG: serine--tRNA ligase [Candidatus Pelagibacter sp. TMED197]|nr:serine--tRNA ligase [Candidatus Pelagibacter sp.]OUW58583.1 MAG: serine--tRNA ligase [Candidatus Pelagibacter sp. TMED197]|tara:strand:- start:893 stop:2140 length:1248 start_codon:yes stop_codon:yes gene_type:complete
MHDLKDLRKNLEIFKKKFKDRNFNFDLKKFSEVDKKNRELINKKELLEQEKKILSKSKEKNNFEKSKKITDKINKILLEQKKTQNLLNEIIFNLPNIAEGSVPIGKDENSNKLVKKNGILKNFNFKVRSHVEIGNKDNNIDFDTSIKLSGSRFVVLKDKLALLERSLINFMLDIHTQNFNYTEISPPLIVNEDVMFGTGQLPKFEEDQFEIQIENNEDRKFLIPTAEVVLTNLVRKSNLNLKDLPLRFVASTPCFRKEAGSYGKDTKGMMRQHQFYKVELVSIVEPKDRFDELERMLNCAEEILKKLDIPYQVVLLSSGDMGFSAEKTYDIEAWIPSEKKYREISSCSSCGSFQSRRMGAKYKSTKGTEFVSTLNGSGLAVGRLMIALLENNQNEDGSINIPNNLKKYMNNLDKI